MSVWHEITDIDDISLSDDSEEVHICVNGDHYGADYISIPIEFIRKIFDLAEQKQG